MASVTLVHVAKQYPDNPQRVVRDFHLVIEDKEFVVFVGPSGCGKSTTLRMIAGLEEVTAGDIYIGERRVNDLPSKDRNIAMVFQNYALYPNMTVRQNMAFGLKVRSVPKDEIDRRVNDAAQILGIEKLLNRKPKELSGGQRQRVALGRAIVREPAVFLMDEPLSNLDAKLRVQMRAEIRKLHQRLQATTIYVTHDQTEAMTMGDRIVILKDGMIQQNASPKEVYNHPANMFVAGFIGSPAMNFLTGHIVEEDAHLFFKTSCTSIPLPAWRYPTIREKELVNGPIVLGIRPEDLHINGTMIESTVEVVEHMGAEVLVHASIGVASLVARVSTESTYSPGDKITFGIDVDKLHLFHPQTEQNVDVEEVATL